jgi:hypothetical protein
LGEARLFFDAFERAQIQLVLLKSGGADDEVLNPAACERR